VYAVEVTLDNTLSKIPVEAKELIVRKTYNVDTDKDDYYLNGKHIIEKELFNLFESGGFSLSGQSQFQIVQQGEVEKLVQRGENGFLDMLKEITGTASFD
jgi:structural maintenance of chromosome 3 (chondroitin sulfate proteoglycan 6)